jgi:hypothetical protein
MAGSATRTASYGAASIQPLVASWGSCIRTSCFFWFAREIEIQLFIGLNFAGFPAQARLDTIRAGFFCWLHTLLLAVIGCAVPAMTADCIAREKRTGAFELILITPLKVKQIISGRVFELWKMFLPAGAVLALFAGSRLDARTAIALALAFLSLPVFALYCLILIDQSPASILCRVNSQISPSHCLCKRA